MVGHAWTSVAVSVLDETVFLAVLRIILAFIAAWAGLMIILNMAFDSMRRSLGELAKRILRQEDHADDLEKFPELKPVTAAVATLRQSLTASESHYRTLLEHSPDGVFRYDTAGRLVYANPAARERHAGSDLLGKRPREFGMVPAATADLIENAIHTVLDTGRNVERCYPLPTRDGRQLYTKASWTAEMDDRGRVVSVLGISRDVTELQTANERFSTLFNLNPNILVLTRKADGAIIDVNRAFLEKSGLTMEEAIGRHAAKLGLWLEAGQQQELVEQLVGDGRLENCEIRCTVRGQAYTGLLSSAGVSINGEACWLHVVTDITDKKKIDAELARLESFNLIGEMAASIGHEVRNPMTTVRGYLQMFQRKAAFDPYSAQLSLMIEEIDRANSIITEFLSLAKNKVTVMKQGNLNSVLHTLEPLLQADVLRRGHQLNISTTPIPDTVYDENELRQLILNLFRNAMEAMDLPGVVSIRTYDDGDAVILSVSDTGRGVAPDIMARLGTPFLTTKEQGTGLGLAVCYRIAQRHDAIITVHTTPGGTTFSVKFKPCRPPDAIGL